MATISTFGLTITSDDWTAIADGSTYASVGVQAVGQTSIRIAVASSKPAIDTNDFFVLTPQPDGEQLTNIGLGTGNIAYGLPMGAQGFVRGMLTAS